MRHPQLVILDSDGWLARQLADLAAESQWLVRDPKTPKAALALLRDPRPSAFLIRVEPAPAGSTVPPDEAFASIAEASRLHPDVAIVVVSDLKLPDADRIAWTGLLFDLGARFVLFPPLAKSVLEDVASGLMASAVKRSASPTRTEGVIDLADEEHE